MRQLEHLGIPTIAKRNALYLVYAGDSIPPVLGVPGDLVSEESALCRNRKLSRSDPGFAKEGPRGFASQHKKKNTCSQDLRANEIGRAKLDYSKLMIRIDLVQRISL